MSPVTRLCLALTVLVAPAITGAAGISAVDSVSINVSDLDRAETFYTQVLGFTCESEHEVAGEAYEHLYGVFGSRVRSVRLRLGDEAIELTQFLEARFA